MPQIKYAREAVKAGKTCLGIKAIDGVVIATEKKEPSILVDEKSTHKIVKLSNNAGMSYAGLGPDFRVLTRNGRKAAQTYYLQYLDPIPCSQLVREVASTMQEFTQSGGVRPFGVSLFMAGYDDNGPQLYQVDASGSYWAWKASAIGRNSENAKTFLSKRYREDLELEDAINTAILTLKDGYEGEINEKNIEIAVIGADRQFRVLPESEVRDYVAEVN